MNKKITDEFIQGMSKGRADSGYGDTSVYASEVDDYTFSIILTQGLNRQIRYMCRHFDYHVTKLKRVRIMNIRLGNLPGWKVAGCNSGRT